MAGGRSKLRSARRGWVLGAAVVVIAALAAPASGVAPHGGSGGQSIADVEPVKDGVSKKSVTIVFPVVDLSAASAAITTTAAPRTHPRRADRSFERPPAMCSPPKTLT
jgi:hypothetical protein